VHKIIRMLTLLALLPTAMLAQAAPATQAPASPIQERGYLLSTIDFGGSSNGDGRIFTLGVSAGYEFNRHVSVSARLPIYFVTATGVTNLPSGQSTLSNNGVGDPELNLGLTFSRHTLVCQTGLTTWLPVTSTSNGFSTGSVLVDWTSRLSKRVGRLVPFGRLDLANTVPDTPVFILPYTAQGFNTRLEGGTNVEMTKILSAGASFYGVLPSGQQHVYSRMVTSSNSGMTGMAQSGRGGNGFMMNPVTVGDDLTSDHGFSTWLSASLPNNIGLQVAYTRSYGYDLNTVSFGAVYNLGAALRHRHAYP
jgi:hypothetical protein